MPLDDKIKQYLSDRVVLKSLTRWNEAYKEFPRYVMEYLVSRYVVPENPINGQKKIDKILQEHYVESQARELIKSKIKEKGEYTLLGLIQVRLDQSKDHYWAEVAALGDNFVRISNKVLKEYGDILLAGGAWGTVVIEYDPKYELKKRIYPFYIKEFTPFQITRLDLDDFCNKRNYFETNEWIDLLIRSIGFEPVKFTEREKMLLLLRLVPFVETNYNMIELGPRETGKTYTYRNTSSKSFVISGSNISTPSLFYNIARNKIGILGQKDVVFFDEISNTNFDDMETINNLKDYMQSGKFSRGSQEFPAQASIVLAGNIDTDLENKKPVEHYLHLFEVLPEELGNDSAFLDRIQSFLPGWELPKIKPENYAEGYGFVTDYLAEIFTRLRRKNYQILINAKVKFSKMTGRNQDAIKKTTSGLLKLIFPHKDTENITNEELKMCIDLAVESRQRIIDQLAIAHSEEFKGINLEKNISFIK